MIQINLNKAIDIRKDQIRAERAPLLSALDLELMRATEIQDTERVASIVTEKNRLRDITMLADQAGSVDDLLAIVVDCQILTSV